MNTTSELSGNLHRLLAHPARGVAGLVEDLVVACREHPLRLDWQAGRCHVRSRRDDGEQLLDVPLRKSVFRAILARVAVLCNERIPNSVSPYGGQGELTVGVNPPAICRVTFINTSTEQKLELLTEIEPAAEGPQKNGPTNLMR